MDYREQILNILHTTPESRVTMTRKLNITKAWVTKITSALLAAGIIEEHEVRDTAFGRPQQLLTVKKNQFFSVTIMMRSYGLQATLNDYQTGEAPRAALDEAIDGTMDAQQMARRLDQIINTLCQQSGVARPQIKHLALALQGGIEQHSGVVRWCPVLDGRNVPLRDVIQQQCGIESQVVNIAWCSCYMISKRQRDRESWIAFMPGFGSLGYGYSIDGKAGLGDNGFYPEIVHLPYEGGLENAFLFDPATPVLSTARVADALCFAICCTAPIHNIKRVILTGELFEEYAELLIPATQQRLERHSSEHINTIRLEYMPAHYNFSMTGLIHLSADAITATLLR